MPSAFTYFSISRVTALLPSPSVICLASTRRRTLIIRLLLATSATLESLAHQSLVLVSRSCLHAFSARCHAWQMVRGQTHGRNPCLFFSLRLDGALAWDEAALR